MDKQQASELVASKIKEIESLLKEIKEIADTAAISFSLTLGEADNVPRNIGGSYYGKNSIIDSDDRYLLTYEWGDESHLEETEEVDKYGDHQYKLTRGAWEAWTSSAEHC